MREYMSPKRRFMAAVCGGRVDRPPVGTVTSLANVEAMDLCGAPFPEAHLDPERMARLAAYISLETGFDMIFPVFSVVHEAAALGARVDWGSLTEMPQVRTALWQRSGEIAIPADFEARPAMAVVTGALRRLRERHGAAHAVVGKVFGPWSLGFQLFGMENILVMSIEDPDELRRILARLASVTLRSATAQVLAGADVLCLADHCSRDVCSPQTYEKYLLPLHLEISRRVPCPVVLHSCGDTSDRIQLFAASTLSGFHYDTKVPAATARALAGDGLSLMGGVSNLESLLPGDEARIAADVEAALAAGIDIIGPECAIPLRTGMAGLAAISARVRRDGPARAGGRGGGRE